MKAYRWDFQRREHDEVDIPYSCSTYVSDFEAEVTCPRCRRPVKFGETYTSRQYFDRVGFGYGVCSRCHDDEMKEDYDALFGGRE